MASYLSSWFSSPSSSLPVASATPSTGTLPSTDALFNISPPHSDDDDDGFNDKDSDEEHDPQDDAPPAFPALGSAQRVRSQPSASQSKSSSQSNTSNSIPRILTDNSLMPPPPVPSSRSRAHGSSSSSSMLSVPGSSSMLGVPGSSSGSTLMPPPTTLKPPTLSPKKREKVALAPGHSSLDWASLKSSGADLRGGTTQLMRIPPSVLKLHNKKDDAWSAINGKVYNLTPYLPYHPGGERELMRVAGRDGTKLFALTHAWVNVDFMMDACLVGFLVSEPSS